LFEYLKKDKYFKEYYRYIDTKILYLKLILGIKKITLKDFNKIFFDNFIPIKDKLKLLIFKYYLNWKYK